MQIRKLDYIIFYFVSAIFFIMNLTAPFKIWNVISCFVLGLIPAMILGTITNLISIALKKLRKHV